jgi:hypothetical protein
VGQAGRQGRDTWLLNPSCCCCCAEAVGACCCSGRGELPAGPPLACMVAGPGRGRELLDLTDLGFLHADLGRRSQRRSAGPRIAAGEEAGWSGAGPNSGLEWRFFFNARLQREGRLGEGDTAGSVILLRICAESLVFVLKTVQTHSLCRAPLKTVNSTNNGAQSTNYCLVMKYYLRFFLLIII